MSEEGHGDHSGAYRNVLIALLIATIITVGLSHVSFGTHAANIVIGVIVAVVKASLVVAIFMHMKYEKRWWLGLVLFPILLVMIIIFSNFADTALNADQSDPISSFTTPAEEQIKHVGQASHGGGSH
jgi:cytochrome c oxidase subunit 4